MFTIQLINREMLPTRHVLVCEDDIYQQIRITTKLNNMFGSQKQVQVSVVPGAVMGASIINNNIVDLIMLDHDMPHGNGPELLQWMKENNKSIPVITFSGVESNNDNLINNGAIHKFNKERVINGEADEVIHKILGV